jgi:hypothetical protein
MGDITTASGTRVFVGPATDSTFDTLAEFQAISPWTEVGLVESVGEFGDKSNPITFEALGDSRVRKAKGARDAGTLAIVCGADPTDVGQLALTAAEETNSNYAFKVILPDQIGGVGIPTTLYFRGLVMGKRLNVGNNSNVIRRNFDVGINSQIFEDAASAGP